MMEKSKLVEIYKSFLKVSEELAKTIKNETFEENNSPMIYVKENINLINIAIRGEILIKETGDFCGEEAGKIMISLLKEVISEIN